MNNEFTLGQLVLHYVRMIGAVQLKDANVFRFDGGEEYLPALVLAMQLHQPPGDFGLNLTAMLLTCPQYIGLTKMRR